MRRRRARKPIERLVADMKLLDEIIYYPSKYGYYALIARIKGESKPPTSIELLRFKEDIEDDIKYIIGKIRRKLGFGLPDGIKR